MFRLLIATILLFGLFVQASAQSEPETPTTIDRSSTGGAQTLEDILRRQRGEKVDDEFRRDATGRPDAAAAISSQLGTLGGASDPELWRALRYGSADITVSSGGLPATVLIQDGGMRWLDTRGGPLRSYGGFLLLGMLVLLGAFYFLTGRIMIDGPKTGRTIVRFKAFERFSHWLLAGSFILLGISGLITLFGRLAILPLLGKDVFSTLAMSSKWIHNNVAWPFMISLAFVFVLWVVHNIPSKMDLGWIAKGGGLFKKGVHPPARKFNAGQKLIFWSVIILGISISASGLSLLFPFELPMFAVTFEKLNFIGLPQLLGFGQLPTQLAPHEEMQYAQLWHSVIAFVMMAIILAHIYIGSIGMEGAYDAMGSGEVEEQWAKEHHSLWVEEVGQAEQTAPIAEPEPAE